MTGAPPRQPGSARRSLPAGLCRPNPLTRLHVVGCHRSGTTLMTELLGNCFAIDGRADHEQALWEPVPARRGVYLTKKPPDTIRIRRAFLLDPQLYLVAMIRDPRGVITSRHPSFPDVFFSSFWRWEQYARAIESLAAHPRCVAVRYEDLVAAPDVVQGRLAEAFPFLEPRARFSSFPEGATVHERAGTSMRGVRAIDRSSLESWRRELPRVKGELLLHPQMADWLVRLGYERDHDWTRELETAEPYFGDYKNERPHAWRRAEASLRFGFKTLRYVWRRNLLAAPA